MLANQDMNRKPNKEAKAKLCIGTKVLVSYTFNWMRDDSFSVWVVDTRAWSDFLIERGHFDDKWESWGLDLWYGLDICGSFGAKEDLVHNSTK